MSDGFLDLRCNGSAHGAEHRRRDSRPRRTSSTVGSGPSTVVQFALSSLTDFCQHKDRAFAVEDFKLDLSGDGYDEIDDFDEDFSIMLFVL